MLEQTQATLHHNVLQNRPWWDIDRRAFGGDDDDGALELHATAEIDRTGDGEMVELEDLGDRRDAGLEAGDLLEVGAELDERCAAETGRVHQ